MTSWCVTYKIVIECIFVSLREPLSSRAQLWTCGRESTAQDHNRGLKVPYSPILWLYPSSPGEINLNIGSPLQVFSAGWRSVGKDILMVTKQHISSLSEYHCMGSQFSNKSTNYTRICRWWKCINSRSGPRKFQCIFKNMHHYNFHCIHFWNEGTRRYATEISITDAPFWFSHGAGDRAYPLNNESKVASICLAAPCPRSCWSRKANSSFSGTRYQVPQWESSQPHTTLVPATPSKRGRGSAGVGQPTQCRRTWVSIAQNTLANAVFHVVVFSRC